jgi:hypothetical protein
MGSSLSFHFPAHINSVASLKQTTNEAGRAIRRPFQIPLAKLSLEKMSPAGQDNFGDEGESLIQWLQKRCFQGAFSFGASHTHPN